MCVPEKSVPFRYLNLLHESAQRILGRRTRASYMRACVRMYATQKLASHRPKLKINKKIETFMWDNRAWDGCGTAALAMEASHG
jgi:hypothetical protein